jgi:hypothetical protein
MGAVVVAVEAVVAAVGTVLAAVGTVLAARVAAGLAGDQHPGQRPITSQPPTPLRPQRPHPADLTPNPPQPPRRLSRSTVTVNWWLVECVFESMAVTYQSGTSTQPPSAKLGTTFLAGVGAERAGAALPGG